MSNSRAHTDIKYTLSYRYIMHLIYSVSVLIHPVVVVQQGVLALLYNTGLKLNTGLIFIAFMLPQPRKIFSDYLNTLLKIYKFIIN